MNGYTRVSPPNVFGGRRECALSFYRPTSGCNAAKKSKRNKTKPTKPQLSTRITRRPRNTLGGVIPRSRHSNITIHSYLAIILLLCYYIKYTITIRRIITDNIITKYE